MSNPDVSSTDDQRRDLMTPAEVGRLFGVTAKTASRWADEGHLDSVRTLGGNRRFLAEQVHQLYSEYLRVQNPGTTAQATDGSSGNDQGTRVEQLSETTHPPR